MKLPKRPVESEEEAQGWKLLGNSIGALVSTWYRTRKIHGPILDPALEQHDQAMQDLERAISMLGLPVPGGPREKN